MSSAEEPAVRPRPRLTRNLAVGRNATPAVLTQFIVAGSSAVLQIIVARRLGAAALGNYSIFLSLLITVNALQSGWLGDSLTVLERFDPQIRAALFRSQWAIIALSGFVGFAFSELLGVGDVKVSLLCAFAVVVWCIEETGRRIMMARLEFWQLLINDGTYAFAALAFAAAIGRAGRLTLSWIVLSMAVGSLAAIVAAAIQIPRNEWTKGEVDQSSEGMRTLARFAAWRSGQAGLRPLGLLLVRVAIVLYTSRALLGQIEAARLLMAPAMTLVAGIGVFLLPVYARGERLGGEARRRNPPGQVLVVLGVVTALYGLFAAVFAEPMTRLLTSGSVPPSRVAVFAWVVWTIGYASPHGNLAVARKMSREVFIIRALDTVIGLTLTVVLLQAHVSKLSPFGAGIGMLIGTFLVARLLHRRD